MDKLIPLDYGETYHIYNKSVGDVLLFKSQSDYKYFMVKLKRFILPIADIYAYCLIPNHFHLLVKIKESEQVADLNNKYDTQWIAKVFRNFFISYARSYNNVYQRQGRLFFQAFKRIKVDSLDYFLDLVVYIHRNPIHHGIVSDFSEWKYSSFNSFLSMKESNIDRKEVLSYFDSLDYFIELHNDLKKEFVNRNYYLE